MHRGSRKHILDWVESPDFVSEFTQLLHPSGAIISSEDSWMPKGHLHDKEARLDIHGPDLLDNGWWQRLRNWWLIHNGRANTPNWDLVATCSVEGNKGLVLVEAKAHVSELKNEGKKLKSNSSARSHENHKRIGEAIKEASDALNRVIPDVSLSRDSHYQIANRVAFAWKLASMGLNVVLVYLGFTGDRDIGDIGEPLRDDAHWQSVFAAHAQGVLPANFVDREIDCGVASMHMFVRSRRVDVLTELPK